MPEYLIAIGAQDKPTILWQIELFYYSYLKYVDRSVYDLMFYVADWNGCPLSDWCKKLISTGYPITLTPDYSKQLGQDGVDNKYLTLIHHALSTLDGRHLIIMDSDIILLPRFNELFRLAPESVLAFEVNEIHRARVAGLVGWYNAHYAACVKPDDVMVAPSLIMRADFAGQFLAEYCAVIRSCPKEKLYNPRAATMVGKGCLQQHRGYAMNRITMFLSNNETLTSRERVFDYANLHYWAKDKVFDKRSYRDVSPFDKPRRAWTDAGYRAASFIWDMVEEMKPCRDFGNFPKFS